MRLLPPQAHQAGEDGGGGRVTPEAFRVWMAAHQWTVRGLAIALGVAPSTIQRWRDGSRPVPPYLNMALRTLVVRRGTRGD